MPGSERISAQSTKISASGILRAFLGRELRLKFQKKPANQAVPQTAAGAVVINVISETMDLLRSIWAPWVPLGRSRPVNRESNFSSELLVPYILECELAA